MLVKLLVSGGGQLIIFSVVSFSRGTTILKSINTNVKGMVYDHELCFTHSNTMVSYLPVYMVLLNFDNFVAV